MLSYIISSYIVVSAFIGLTYFDMLDEIEDVKKKHWLTIKACLLIMFAPVTLVYIIIVVMFLHKENIEIL